MCFHTGLLSMLKPSNFCNLDAGQSTIAKCLYEGEYGQNEEYRVMLDLSYNHF